MTSPERRLKNAQERLQVPIQLLLFFGIIWTTVAAFGLFVLLNHPEEGLRGARHWKTVIFATASALAALAAVYGLWTGKPYGWKIANYLFECCINNVLFGIAMVVLLAVTVMVFFSKQPMAAFMFIAIGMTVIFMRVTARSALQTLHHPDVMDVYIPYEHEDDESEDR